MDPLGNMLAWSTDLTKDVWQRDPLLSASGGVADPFGGTQACRLVNNGQVPQAITQSVGANGGYQYTFSVYASAPSPETITLVQQSGSVVNRVAVPIDGMWVRCMASARLNSTSELAIFGVELQPGSTVVLAAPQAEAQPRAGAYVPSFNKGSVYPGTRFLEDALEMTSSAPEQYSCIVRLRSAGV